MAAPASAPLPYKHVRPHLKIAAVQRASSGRGNLVLYFVSWLIPYMKLEIALRAVANPRRLRILAWLKDPRGHFPPQIDGDLVRDGVCSCSIAQKLRISQPSASEHLNLLTRAGLIRGKKIKQWTFYKRDEKAMRKLKQLMSGV